MTDTPVSLLTLRHRYSGERIKAALFLTKDGAPVYSFRETIKAGRCCDREGKPVLSAPRPFGQGLALADWCQLRAGGERPKREGGTS